jgi:type VI protein secretion system component VasK
MMSSMIWKREWYTVLLTLVVGIPIYFVGVQFLPPGSRFGYAALFGCTIAAGWLAGWGAFSLQERRRISRKQPGPPAF